MAAVLIRQSLSLTKLQQRFFSCSRMASSMAVVYSKHGDPETQLSIEQQTLPEVGEGQVELKVLAAPINPSDINMVEGTYAVRPPLPAVGGNEGVAVVTKVGPGVTKLSVNDWVIPSDAGLGTWRTSLVQSESKLIRVRNDVPPEYAATIFVNPCTALRMLEDFVTLERGDTVVQNGATSMVGQAVIQLAHVRGVRTINIIRDRPDKERVIESLKELGATLVVTEDFAQSAEMKDAMAEADLRPAKLGLNCVGGTSATAVLRLLGEEGTMVTYGGMAKKPITSSATQFIFKDLSLRGFWLTKWTKGHSLEERQAMLDELLGLVKDNKLRFLIEKVPFGNFHEALAKALGKQGHSTGKQVLIME
eukprot:TRINITY_DN12889_c0_g7_i1.p1 TRINITY_DN12889_c0_g7~~TRINITY_DN12889_c0_g7_i1.p1  ORF type:complete len:363 (-),score=73.01 TRINITY_DN12889_c0_g7_i1:73-1161(-)